MSAWTGESIINIKDPHPQALYSKLPDKEVLLEDILMLRQTKNVHEEQVRLLKVQVQKLTKHCERL
jgi:ribosomal protein S15P/S13E